MATQDRLPTGIGASNTWTASAGDKWDCVDDPVGAPNDDTDYCYVSGADGYQTFTFTAFAITSSAVSKVTVSHRVRMVSGAGNITARIRVGGTNYNSASDYISSTSYANYAKDWLTNPKSGAAWTEAEVEGSDVTNPLQQFGMTSAGIGGGEEMRVTQVYCTVTYTEAAGGYIPYPFSRGARGGISCWSGGLQ